MSCTLCWEAYITFWAVLTNVLLILDLWRILNRNSRVYHFQKQVSHCQFKARVAQVLVLCWTGICLAVSIQSGLQAWIEDLVHVSELGHLVENSLDLLTGQNRLRRPSWGPQSLHGLQRKTNRLYLRSRWKVNWCWSKEHAMWEKQAVVKWEANVWSFFTESNESTDLKKCVAEEDKSSHKGWWKDVAAQRQCNVPRHEVSPDIVLQVSCLRMNQEGSSCC